MCIQEVSWGLVEISTSRVQQSTGIQRATTDAPAAEHSGLDGHCRVVLVRERSQAFMPLSSLLPLSSHWICSRLGARAWAVRLCLLFSPQVVSVSLWAHGLHHARLPCPSLSLRACSNISPLSQWCNPTLSSSLAPLASFLQYFPGSIFSNESALCIRWPKYWSFSISLPMNIQGWFPLESTGLNCLLAKGLSSLLQHHNLKASVLWHSTFFMVQLSHPYMTTGKTIALTMCTFVNKVKSLLFNTLCLS